MSDTKFPLAPTFIGGHRKAGTTLLLTLMDGHPQLNTFPADSGFFYAYFPLYDTNKYSNEDRINRIIEFCYGNLEEELDKVGINKEIGFPLNSLKEVFRKKALNAGTLDSKTMLPLMLDAYRECSPFDTDKQVRFLEKTSSSDIYASSIFKWFPDAKFIHLVRDPRDNFASLKSGWSKKYSERADDLVFLRQSMLVRGLLTYEFAQFNLERYGKDRYKVVRFEDLTTNPEKELQEICRFLDISYHESMLMPTVCNSAWDGNNFDGLKFVKPSPVNINKWQTRITDMEAMLIEYHFREVMDNFGYEPFFDFHAKMDAAVEHYKQYNYAQNVKV